MKYCLLLFSFLLMACQPTTPVSIQQAWIRATVEGQPVAAAYMSIQANQTVALVKVETSVAQTAEIHQMSMQNGIMRMRMLQKLPIAQNATVNLAPNGTHIMLIDLAKPLTVGEHVSLQLIFEKADGSLLEQNLQVPVLKQAP